MQLLNFHQPSAQLWAYVLHAVVKPREIGTVQFVLVIASACVGAVLHGVAMALRKVYGQGSDNFWLEWRWWAAVILDGVGGCMVWPAMPFLTVDIIAPLVIIVQLSSSYLIGLAFFKEKCNMQYNIGLAFAVIGVIGISVSTPHHADVFSLNDFWTAWVTPKFLSVIAFAFALLLGSFALAHRSTFWALAAAIAEGIQYIVSRILVDCMIYFEIGFLTKPAVLVAFLTKGSCILMSLEFQQRGLESDLSRFAGIYLVGCTFFMCLFGTVFFGESVSLYFTFAISSCFTLSGIWLMNSAENAVEDKVGESPCKDEDVRDDDSAYEGAEVIP